MHGRVWNVINKVFVYTVVNGNCLYSKVSRYGSAKNHRNKVDYMERGKKG